MDTDDEKLIQHAMDTCHKLREALDLIETTRKAARTPIEDGELDFVTVRGELDDMEYYLMNARQAETTLRYSFSEIVALVKRLQHAYRTAYRAWQAAQHDAQTIQHETELKVIRRVIADIDQQSVELLNRLCELLAKRVGLERFALQQDIALLVEKYG
jgi:hypothetical protein